MNEILEVDCSSIFGTLTATTASIGNVYTKQETQALVVDATHTLTYIDTSGSEVYTAPHPNRLRFKGADVTWDSVNEVLEVDCSTIIGDLAAGSASLKTYASGFVSLENTAASSPPKVILRENGRIVLNSTGSEVIRFENNGAGLLTLSPTAATFTKELKCDQDILLGTDKKI